MLLIPSRTVFSEAQQRQKGPSVSRNKNNNYAHQLSSLNPLRGKEFKFQAWRDQSCLKRLCSQLRPPFVSPFHFCNTSLPFKGLLDMGVHVPQ